MAATVLKTRRAVQMSVFVVRAFVRLRELAGLHRELASKIKELEERVGKHDSSIQEIVRALRQLMKPPERPRRQIGFRVEEAKATYRVKRKQSK